MARHTQGTTGWLWVLPSLLVPLVVAAVAWTAHVASEGDQVAPNVTFAGVDISRLSVSDAADQVSARENDLLNAPVVVDLGERRIVMTAEEIGYDYLYSETVSNVIAARHATTPWEEFVDWITIPVETVTVEDHFTLNESIAWERLSQEDFVLEEPVEPELALSDDADLHVVPGTDGVGINREQVIADLKAADISVGPVEILASRMRIPHDVSNEEAERVAADTNDLTWRGFLAIVGGQSADFDPGHIRRHISTTIAHGEMSVDLDVESFHAEIEAAFDEPIGGLTAPQLEVVEGEIVVVAEGQPPPVCCSRDSVRAALESYFDGGPEWYVLDTRPSDDETLVAWADGSYITEPVAEFTTHHACCQNRVVNIQTIADALTGKYLIPGETLSLNEFVGPRTREKGYLPAGAIRGGHMTDEVGGGVSQFVTTLFNAAFFAGLDLDEYQSHTVYFSRYPFGREATLSLPGPDLVITNSTDYPVLIWPTYTDTSITVTMYSNHNVEVEELDQRVSRRNQCRHSQIDRQRTFSDGRVVVDTIVANYRPANGIDCNGNSIPRG